MVLCKYGGTPPNPLASRSSHRSSLPACACWRFVWCKSNTGESRGWEVVPGKPSASLHPVWRKRH
ncbi:MAG: hypothetical protein IJM89_07990, partial [Bacteroidales bacterium]|nr:hypothetical protein [Bacteroidales bacterium]